ncbi:hypothetical protein KEM48_002050 [Puccinia striiformis f. sp. tritici PST-130]|nr:hypothetical protein KEM48_002050 [Puccinia striiformis f. sp. tritici PST-130]
MAWMSSRPSGWLPNGSAASPGHRDGSPTAWSSSRSSGWLPDGLELIQVIGKPSQRPGAHPGHWEAIPTAWSSSRPLGSHPDGLELIQAIGKPSRWPRGATVRALPVEKPKKKNNLFFVEYSSNTRIFDESVFEGPQKPVEYRRAMPCLEVKFPVI